MGGKHSTFNMALCDRDFAASATAADLDGAWLRRLRERCRKPTCWRCTDSRTLARSAEPDGAAAAAALGQRLPADDDGARRRRRQALISNSISPPAEGQGTQAAGAAGLSLSSRGRPMPRSNACSTASSGSSRCGWPNRKLPNVFADPGVEEFIRLACLTPLADGGHVIDIHALECDDEVIAIFAGVADGDRFSMMFNTYTMSENSVTAPA